MPLLAISAIATLKPGKVTGKCMEPGYNNGEYNILWRPAYWFSPPGRQNLVLFEMPNGKNKRVILFKRVIALPGENVSMRKGILYINGKKTDEPYSKLKGTFDLKSFKVPEGCVFVMPDNRKIQNIENMAILVKYENIIGSPLW
jgi:signal peptidase I